MSEATGRDREVGMKKEKRWRHRWTDGSTDKKKRINEEREEDKTERREEKAKTRAKNLKTLRVPTGNSKNSRVYIRILITKGQRGNFQSSCT